MENIKQREDYIKKIKPFINKHVIKILTGIRRSGKSTIMLMLIKELKKIGIDDSCIFHVNFNNLEYNNMTQIDLLNLLKSKFVNNTKTYFILDEIQEIEGWEKAINEIFDNNEYNADIYLTGSNSRMLSSEIATYLTGRYVRFEVLPLSFKEYMSFQNINKDKHLAFLDYFKLGGFPAVHANNFNIETTYTTVLDIYQTVVFTDIVKRNNIRNIDQLERIVKFVIENIGKTFSAKSISDYLKSQNRKIDIETVYNYLLNLESAYILYRCFRYDIKGKEILKTGEKFYLSDMSIKHSLLGFHETGIASGLENIIYLELRRRGYTVYVGKLR